MRRYPQYKDSGIEWIEKMPKHWHLKRLKYMSFMNSKALAESTDESYEFQYIDIGNVDLEKGFTLEEKIRFVNAPSRARRIVRKNDTILSTVRTYLKAIAHFELEVKDIIVSTGYAVISPKGEIYPKYLYYVLRSENFIDRVCALSVGVSYPAINAEDLARIKIWYPEEKEERISIVHYLDRKTAQIDDLIAKKERVVELLKEERTAIINQTVTKGIDSNVEIKDSDIEWLGKIPKHWEVKRLKYLVTRKLEYGANEVAELAESDMPRYIRITDFDGDGKLRNDTFKSLPEDIANDYLLNEGDILFARSGATVGKTFQFKDYEGKACFAGYLIRATPDMKKMLSNFLYYYTRSSVYEDWKNSIFNQATIQNIGADKYAVLFVPFTSIEEQKVIISFLDKKTKQIDEQTEREEKSIELLKEYRTALISEVVTGKIDVRGNA